MTLFFKPPAGLKSTAAIERFDRIGPKVRASVDGSLQPRLHARRIPRILQYIHPEIFAYTIMMSKRRISSFVVHVVVLLLGTVVAVATAESSDAEHDTLAKNGSPLPPPHKLGIVTTLTDETFEHMTQASTGQTTGSWLVWFYDDPSDDESTTTSLPFHGNFPTESEWLDEHVVVASVHAREGGRLTAERLQVTDSIPSLVYIHRGKMYFYPKPKDRYHWDDILAFCRAPDVIAQARDIPAPPDVFRQLLINFAANPTQRIVLGGMVAIVVLGLVFGAVAARLYGSKAKAE